MGTKSSFVPLLMVPNNDGSPIHYFLGTQEDTQEAVTVIYDTVIYLVLLRWELWLHRLKQKYPIFIAIVVWDADAIHLHR
ncbi:hypothetical protein SLA2020_131040 [Shorea laevis]